MMKLSPYLIAGLCTVPAAAQVGRLNWAGEGSPHVILGTWSLPEAAPRTVRPGSTSLGPEAAPDVDDDDAELQMLNDEADRSRDPRMRGFGLGRSGVSASGRPSGARDLKETPEYRRAFLQGRQRERESGGQATEEGRLYDGMLRNVVDAGEGEVRQGIGLMKTYLVQQTQE